MNIKRIELDIIDSTSTYIKQNLDKLESFTFVYANQQNSGHGRMSREWESEYGKNILLSFLIKDDELTKSFDSLSLLIATSIYKLLRSYGVENVKIKWPNDVMVGDKKIAGILLEGSLPNYIIIGVGININQKTLKYGNAISLFNLLNQEFSLDKIKDDIEKIIKNDISDFRNDKFNYLKLYKSVDYLIDKLVTFDYQNKKLTGIVLGVDECNKIMIQTNNQTLHISCGEISLNKWFIKIF